MELSFLEVLININVYLESKNIVSFKPKSILIRKHEAIHCTTPTFFPV